MPDGGVAQRYAANLHFRVVAACGRHLGKE